MGWNQKGLLFVLASEFAVDIKTVPSGLDVVSVALDFKPDIFFADILLSKKNGYDVCGEVKLHDQLKQIPFVLMWSNFMDFNMPLALKNGASDKLEKPFDSQTLKELIKRLVAKVSNHPLEGLLVQPRLPDFTEAPTYIRTKAEFDLKSTESTKFTDLDSDEFQSVKLQLGTSEAAIEHMQSSETIVTDAPILQQSMQPEMEPVKKQVSKIAPSAEIKKSSSNQGDLNEIHIETENFGQFEQVTSVKVDHDLDDLDSQIGRNIQEYVADTTIARVRSQMNPPGKKSKFDEQLMREEIRMVAEKICWQVIPDVAERIVREEIQKLMKNIEKSI